MNSIPEIMCHMHTYGELAGVLTAKRSLHFCATLDLGMREYEAE